MAVSKSRGTPALKAIEQESAGVPDVYCHPVVKETVALHAALLSVYPGNLRVIGVLEHQARVLLSHFNIKDEAVCVQLSNWLPECVGLNPAQIFKQDLTIHHMRLTVAREHGFESWTDAQLAGNVRLDATFEAAVDAALSGNLKKLDQLVRENPDLVTQRSQFGHGATLLVYMAANGVETWRQVVPANAASILQYLLDAGADPEAKICVYGGLHSTLELLLSSAHPRDAGVLDEMAAVLSREA